MFVRSSRSSIRQKLAMEMALKEKEMMFALAQKERDAKEKESEKEEKESGETEHSMPMAPPVDLSPILTAISEMKQTMHGIQEKMTTKKVSVQRDKSGNLVGATIEQE